MDSRPTAALKEHTGASRPLRLWMPRLLQREGRLLSWGAQARRTGRTARRGPHLLATRDPIRSYFPSKDFIFSDPFIVSDPQP